MYNFLYMARLPSKDRSLVFLSPAEFENRQRLFERMRYWYLEVLLNLVETHKNVIDELEMKITFERFRQLIKFFELEK